LPTAVAWTGTLEPTRGAARRKPGLVEHHETAGAGRDQEEGLAQRLRRFLQHRARCDDDGLTLQDAQPQGQQPDPRSVATALVAFDQTAPAQGGEQPVGARFGKPERAPDGRHSLRARRAVKVEEDFDGFLDGAEGFHALLLKGITGNLVPYIRTVFCLTEQNVPGRRRPATRPVRLGSRLRRR
jgi:hypothetical protein